MAVGRDVVDALYRALLGYPADEDGLAHWSAAPSVDDVIAALLSTDRFAERAAALVDASGAPITATDSAVAALRLEHGAGLMELVDAPDGVAPFAGLDALPWGLVCAGIPDAAVQVVGRYAAELAAELLSRGVTRTAHAGTQGGRWAVAAPDVLLLTGTGDLAGLRAARPDLLRAVRSRVVLPVQVPVGRPFDEATALRDKARRYVHACGFTGVRHVFRRRHGGGVVVLDVSAATPTPGALMTTAVTEVDPVLVPMTTWLVGDRAPVEEVR